MVTFKSLTVTTNLESPKDISFVVVLTTLIIEHLVYLDVDVTGALIAIKYIVSD